MNSKKLSEYSKNNLVNLSSHAFSIELKSKNYLNLLTIPSRVDEQLMIEGFLGELEAVSLVEGVMLDIQGTFGSLKMGLKEDELKKLCSSTKKTELTLKESVGDEN